MRKVLFFVVLVSGCDGSASTPQMAKPVDDGPAVKLLPVDAPKPATTSPAAADALAKLLIAHTNGAPSTLAAFRNCTVRRKGELNQAGTMVPAECIDRFAWPDRYRADWTFASTGPIVFMHGETVSFSAHISQATPSPLSAAETANNLEDIRSTWLTLLVPLADAKDYVAEMVSDPEARAVRIWVGTQPPCVLVIDPKTQLLQKVLFEKVGNGRRETWSFVLENLKPVKGVMLPHKVTYTAGRQPGAVWNTIEYDSVASFPAGTFEKP